MSIWGVEASPAGVDWDAIRIPDATGLTLYGQLTADPDTADRLGPVVLSARSQATYWLVTAGSGHGGWPPSCRLLGRGSMLLLPEPGVDARCARWLHQPTTPGRLTGAVWLADALHHLETSMSSEPTYTCAPCGQPATGTPAWIDGGDHSQGVIDVTHDACYQEVLKRPLALRHEGGR